MCACLCIGAQFKHMVMRREPEDDLRLLRSSHLFFFLETGSFIGLEPTWYARLLGQGALGTCPSLPLSAGITNVSPCGFELQTQVLTRIREALDGLSFSPNPKNE